MLSICIPTYNRKKYLKEILDEILDEALKLNIDVIVCDNFSSDGTREYLKSLKIHYTNLKIYLNNENVGLDRNMLKSLEKSKTKYSLWLGDDDLIEKESLLKLKSAVESYDDFDFMIVNGRTEQGFRHLKILTDIVLDDPRELIKNYEDKLTFGYTVVKNKVIEKKIKIEKYIGSLHAYSLYIFEYLKDEYLKNKRLKIVLLEEDIVTRRDVGKSYSDKLLDLFFIEMPIQKKLYPEFYTESLIGRRKEYQNELTRFRRLITWRQSGLNFSNHKKYTETLDSSIIKLKVILSCFIPKVLIVILKKIKKSLKKNRILGAKNEK